MTFDFFFEQFASATAGFVLGVLTAGWLYAVWKRWHPQTIRYWRSWYTSPRLLILCGAVLAMLWTGLFFTVR